MSIKRIRCISNTYHLVIRGVNRQLIFECDDDCRKFIEIMKNNVERAQAKLYAWCLMGNHVHILVEEGNDSISKMMQRIEVSYVKCFNKKNERVGPLYQGRFYSKPVEDDAAFERVRKYIAMNPVKAGLASDARRYLWSWLWEERGREEPVQFGEYDFSAEEEWDFEMEQWSCEEQRVVDDFEALKIMGKITGYGSTSEIQRLTKRERDNVVTKLAEARLKIAQISRITGVGKRTVYRIVSRR